MNYESMKFKSAVHRVEKSGRQIGSDYRLVISRVDCKALPMPTAALIRNKAFRQRAQGPNPNPNQKLTYSALNQFRLVIFDFTDQPFYNFN